ncbi:hypothetical protein [Thalassovita sp.]|uniref:hypothetical protein n=1 Tax=Thalassovita sp. TaxID=1979401 RepID=UPI0029DE8BE0|nr:hypothetical protein [Thalassovita sp.]
MFAALRQILQIALPLLILLSQPVAAQQLDDPFKPEWLPPNDTKYLQTGLALEGLYVGLIDGEWGSGSQRALDKFLAGRVSGQQITYRDLAPLVQRTQLSIQADFWQGITDFPDKVSFLAPLAIVQQDRGSDLYTLSSPDGSLKIRLIEQEKDKTIEMHQWLIDNHKGTKQELYQNYDDARLITSGVLKSGKTVYLRSQFTRAGTIVTVLVQYEPWQKERGALISSSITFDGMASLSLDSYSPLAEILRLANRPARPSQPVGGGGIGISRPAPGGAGRPGGGTGSGAGISRPAPGSATQPGSGSGGGIARPSAPIASHTFTIPALPGMAD